MEQESATARFSLSMRRSSAAKGSHGEMQTLVLETRAIAPSCDIPQLRNLSQFDESCAEAEQMFAFPLIILYSPPTDVLHVLGKLARSGRGLPITQ